MGFSLRVLAGVGGKDMERGNSRFERGMAVGNHVDGWEIIG